MAYVTYKNRSSSDYKFTVDTLNDPVIGDLKQLLKEHNWVLNRVNKNLGFRKYNTKGIRIRPRGPRKNSWAHDTPWENATHYDVYLREYK
jgi:hypothetical protein